MTLPALLLGMIVATLYGAAFHLWRGGSLARLVMYILVAWFGFWAGHFIAQKMDWTFLSLGPLHLGLATILSLICLALVYWLSRVEQVRR
jgi:hypothetical protein